MRVLVFSSVMACLSTTASFAAPVASLRPEGRPDGIALKDNDYPSDAVTTIRPVARPDLVPQSVAENPGFQTWIKEFRKRAVVQDISSATLNRAFNGVTYDPEVIRRDQNQSEFTTSIWEYLDSAVSDKRIENGKEALRLHYQQLQQIEATYGVDKEVVLAVWGMESSYGTFRGNMDVIRSLSTLAFDGRRGKFFESQLIAALQILQSGDVPPREMTGSWAGAMGHTQFIPTSYLAYAVDYTGDGKRDIWSDNPSDALASTAAYLERFGWVKGQPWGVEVQLPRGFNYGLANRRTKKNPAQWSALGITRIDGRAVPDYGAGSILLPAGSNGAAFMVFKNFRVIERYNAADAYVIAVGHLSDRIKGGDPIRHPWPRDDRDLSFKERQEMQQRLTRKGFDTQGVDGKIGPNTSAAVRAYQVANSLVPDGHASLSLLKHLR